MESNKPKGYYMRMYHRYLGFFLAGIMAVYAISGVVMIFRDTDFLKQEKQVVRELAPNLAGEALGTALRIKNFKPEKVDGDVVTFKGGVYNGTTGQATITVKELPTVLEKMTHMHKATNKDPLFYLNIFFGASLMFFVVSAFWMFLPGTKTFKKGLYFSLGGVALVLLMLLI